MKQSNTPKATGKAGPCICVFTLSTDEGLIGVLQSPKSKPHQATSRSKPVIPRHATLRLSPLNLAWQPCIRHACHFVLICLIATPLATPAQAQARAEILIGLALSETGRFAGASRKLRTATEQAITDLNTAGGVLGKQLKLVVGDDTCTEAGATAIAENFLKQGVHLVVGHQCDRAALSAAAIYAPAGMLYIATESRHPALTERFAGTTILRLAGRDDRQGKAAGTWLADATNSGRTAIIQDRSGYARTIAKGVAEVLAERGRPAPHVIPIFAGETSYDAVVTKVREASIEAVFFAGYPSEAVIILNALQRANLEVKFLGSDSLVTPEFAARPVAHHADVRVLARPVSAVTISLNAGLPGRTRATPAQFTKHGVQETSIAAAIKLWADAARAIGTHEPAAVHGALNSRVFYVPPFGSVTFDAKGDARIPSFAPAVSDGTVWTVEN